MGNKRVVLLVDNRNRDLAGATLIAHHLKQNSVDCFLEPLESYKGCLAAYRPDMIIFNHLTGNHLVAYSNRLAALGVMVAVLPGEGIIYHKESLKFNAGKFHRGAHIDCFFCWNEEHRLALRETGFNSAVRLEVIGPPRFDFLFRTLVSAAPAGRALRGTRRNPLSWSARTSPLHSTKSWREKWRTDSSLLGRTGFPYIKTIGEPSKRTMKRGIVSSVFLTPSYGRPNTMSS